MVTLTPLQMDRLIQLIQQTLTSKIYQFSQSSKGGILMGLHLVKLAKKIQMQKSPLPIMTLIQQALSLKPKI